MAWSARQMPLLFCGSKMGGLEQVPPHLHVAHHYSCRGAAVPAWHTMLCLPAGLGPGTFDQVARTRLCNPGASKPGSMVTLHRVQQGLMFFSFFTLK